MKKEILERAKELEDQIGDYQLISHIMSYPYQRYKLFQKKLCIQHEGGTSTGIVITDRELFSDWEIHEVDVHRSINRSGGGRKGKEVIITNY